MPANRNGLIDMLALKRMDQSALCYNATHSSEHDKEGADDMNDECPKYVPEDIVDFGHLQELPAPADIASLEASARWEQVPKELRIHDFHARGWNGVFHGRDDELARLRAAFAPRASTSEETNHQIMLVYGAQGAGKSALLEQFERESQAAGIAAIGLDQSAFHNAEEFVRQLTETGLWQAATRLRRHAHRILEIAARTAATTVGHAIQTELLRLGMYELLPHWLLGLGAARLDTSTPPSPVEALHRLDNAFDAGFVITVDETQRWRRQENNPMVTYLANLVGDPKHRKAANLRTGGLVLGGLADTADALERLDITRPDFMRVGALAPLAATDAIAGHMWRAEAEPTVVREMVGRWSETLAQQFYIWPHHTICAARAAVRMVEAASEEWAEDPSAPPNWRDHECKLDWARTVAARGTATLYSQRIGVAEQHPQSAVVADIVLLAKATSNRIHRDSLEHLVREHIEERGKSGRLKVEDEIVELMHSGLLEPMLSDRHAQTSYLRIPIPSIMDYVVATHSTRPNRDRVQRALDAAPKDDGDDERNPADWEWS